MAEPKKSYEEMISQILTKMDGLENKISTMQLELNNANLRAENAELRMTAALNGSKNEKKDKLKPLGRGKNRSNKWLNEMVTYNPPRSYDQKDIYFDVEVNGNMWRLMRAKPNRIPRYVAIVAEQRERSEDALTAMLNGMAAEFENASSNDFKESVYVPRNK